MKAIASTLPIGKMALKIAVAATISFIIAQALRAEYSFYAVIAAIIVMGSTAGSTLNLGIQRIIGTIIGAITGAIYSLTVFAVAIQFAHNKINPVSDNITDGNSDSECTPCCRSDRRAVLSTVCG